MWLFHGKRKKKKKVLKEYFSLNLWGLLSTCLSCKNTACCIPSSSWVNHVACMMKTEGSEPWITLHSKPHPFPFLSYPFFSFPPLSSPQSQLETIQSWPTGPLPLTDSNYDSVSEMPFTALPNWLRVSVKGKEVDVLLIFITLKLFSTL